MCSVYIKIRCVFDDVQKKEKCVHTSTGSDDYVPETCVSSFGRRAVMVLMSQKQVDHEFFPLFN